MALNQTNKLVWIVETIYRVHKISFEELNCRWMDNVDLSGGEEMVVVPAVRHIRKMVLRMVETLMEKSVE